MTSERLREQVAALVREWRPATCGYNCEAEVTSESDQQSAMDCADAILALVSPAPGGEVGEGSASQYPDPIEPRGAVPTNDRLTDAQRELLEDKFVLWDKASRAYGSGPDADMSRDYNRRAADALKVALAICSEAS